MTPTRRRSILVGVALAAVATVLGAWALARRGDDGVTIGAPGAPAIPTAPDLEGDRLPDLTFETFAGEEVSLDDYRGRPLVLNVWASTCAPCVKEMPAFERVYQRYRDDVAFVGVNNQDRADRADELATKTGVTYDLVRDPLGDLVVSLELVGMPSTVLADAEGRIMYAKTGELDEDELAGLIEEHLLA